MNMYVKAVLTVIAIMFMSGCATSPSGRTVVGLPGSPLWNMTADDATKREYFTGRCVQMGIKLNTPEMDACIKSAPLPQRRGMACVQMNDLNRTVLCN
jgi:hypothetical protein